MAAHAVFARPPKLRVVDGPAARSNRLQPELKRFDRLSK
jgi:hypothetical protein